jgi:hypothetical protein
MYVRMRSISSMGCPDLHITITRRRQEEDPIRVVIPGGQRPYGGRTGRAALSITPYMNRVGYYRQRNYRSKFILLQ